MRITTLKKQKDFDSVFSDKKSFGNRHFTLLYCDNGLSYNRLGIIISKKFSKKAVDRNRMRRRIKYIYTQQFGKIRTGIDFIIIPKKRCLDDSYSDLSQSFVHLFFKQGLLKEKQNI